MAMRIEAMSMVHIRWLLIPQESRALYKDLLYNVYLESLPGHADVSFHSFQRGRKRPPQPYAHNSHERNDRKFAHVSVLFAHMAKINNIDFRNSEQIAGSTYIADHLEWAQFHSYNQLRTEIKDKFQQLISPLSSDVDKAEVYIAARFAIAMLTHDYSTFKNSIDKEIHKKWALNAIHTGHKEWLVSEIEQAVEHEDFLFSSDHLCYAHSPHDSNEFKYARISVLISNLANDGGDKGRISSGRNSKWNFHVAWARFRSVKEIRQAF